MRPVSPPSQTHAGLWVGTNNSGAPHGRNTLLEVADVFVFCSFFSAPNTFGTCPTAFRDSTRMPPGLPRGGPGPRFGGGRRPYLQHRHAGARGKAPGGGVGLGTREGVSHPLSRAHFPMLGLWNCASVRLQPRPHTDVSTGERSFPALTCTRVRRACWKTIFLFKVLSVDFHSG